MIKSILCAIDINEAESEERVLEMAAKLADMDGAQLDLVTVVPNFRMNLVGSYFDENFQDQAVKQAKEMLKGLSAKVLGAERDGKVRHVVSSGSIYEEILLLAKQAKSDLIVIGAHKPDLKDYLLGPNSARVVRHSNCSVFVVRD